MAIEHDVGTGMLYAEVSAKYGVNANTIRQRAVRGNWVTRKKLEKHLKAKIKSSSDKVLAQLATNWLDKGEEHRRVAFEKAHESVKQFRPRAPKNFRELADAVKVARQSAGLETADVQVATLIQLNERIDSFENEMPIEATLVEDESDQAGEEAESPTLVDDGQPESPALPSPAEASPPLEADAPAPEAGQS